MQRRHLLGLLAGSPLMVSQPGWVLASVLPVIGFFRSTLRPPFENIVTAFEKGLREAGMADGENVSILHRWADNELGRLPGLARELVEARPGVIVGNSLAIDAVRAISNEQAMIFVVADDPVRAGYVSNMSRPGGNITGVTFFGGSQLNAKRLELLHQLAPGTSPVAVLNDSDYPDGETGLSETVSAAAVLGRPLEIVPVRGEAGFENAFARIASLGAGALLVNGSPLFTSRRKKIVELVERLGIPAIYDQRGFVDAGGLASYGASITDAYQQAGGYAARIIRGEAPGGLPVLQPTVFELVLNAASAARVGIELPPSVMLRADDIVE